jgi:hypothetical protein
MVLLRRDERGFWEELGVRRVAEEDVVRCSDGLCWGLEILVESWRKQEDEAQISERDAGGRRRGIESILYLRVLAPDLQKWLGANGEDLWRA